MLRIRTRIHVAPDGTLAGQATGLPAGEHEAEIALVNHAEPTDRPEIAALLARVRAIQSEVARLPVLDDRSPEEILGYNHHGHFD